MKRNIKRILISLAVLAVLAIALSVWGTYMFLEALSASPQFLQILYVR